MVDFNKLSQSKGERQMATDKPTPITDTQPYHDNEEFNMPEEFDNEQPVTNGHLSHPGVTGTNQQGMAVSAFDDVELGDREARDEAERAKLNPPTGDWEKIEAWKSEIRCHSGNCAPGDLDSSGRTTLSLMGKCKPRVLESIEYNPNFFLQVSPDIRYKEDKPAEVDTRYKLYLKAKDLYIALHNEKPRTLRQLRVMLEEDDYIVRTMNGDNGPIVVDIKPKRKMR